jgi:hypothetical protein
MSNVHDSARVFFFLGSLIRRLLCTVQVKFTPTCVQLPGLPCSTLEEREGAVSAHCTCEYGGQPCLEALLDPNSRSNRETRTLIIDYRCSWSVSPGRVLLFTPVLKRNRTVPDLPSL